MSPAWAGVAAIWNVADGALIREFAGHRDILYDAELSPDGKLLATCGYDKEIEVWDAATGKRLRVARRAHRRDLRRRVQP